MTKELFGHFDEKDGVFSKPGFYINESELVISGKIIPLYCEAVGGLDRLTNELEAEREACAMAVINIANKDAGNPYKQALRMGAEAIRARGNT